MSPCEGRSVRKRIFKRIRLTLVGNVLEEASLLQKENWVLGLEKWQRKWTEVVRLERLCKR